MNQSRIEILENELLEMKRDALRLKRLLLFAMSVSILVFFVGFQPAGPARIVEATELVLKDKDRKCQARLFFNDDGLPTLAFYDENGKSRAEVGIWKLQTGFMVFDGAGECNVLLGDNRSNATQLELSQSGGKRVSVVAVGGADKASQFAALSMGDIEEPDEFRIENNRKSTGMAIIGEAVGNDGGNSFLYVGSDKQAQSELTMYDKAGEEILALKATADGKASVGVRDIKQKRMVTIPSP
jgi:hypothetical protein